MPHVSLRAAAPSAGLALRRIPAARRPPSFRRPSLTQCSSNATEQLTAVAARLSTVRCRELLAATCVELLKTALVGSAEGAAVATDAAEGSGNEQLSPETLLESLHATLQSSLQDAAHQIAPAHQEAWGEAQWEVFQEAHTAVHRLLLSLHSQAAEAGSAEGALQMARCLEHGLLVPQDSAASMRQYRVAADLGSAEACLRCGIHAFEGTGPGGRDGARAFDSLSRALELAEGLLAAPASGDGEGAALPDLAAMDPELAVEGDVPSLLTPEEVRFSALTWLGRCYMDGAGVPRSLTEAAACFQKAGNAAELQELAMLKRLYAEVQLPDLPTAA